MNEMSSKSKFQSLSPKEKAEILLHNNYVNPIVIEKIKELFEEQAKEIIDYFDMATENGISDKDFEEIRKKYGVKE